MIPPAASAPGHWTLKTLGVLAACLTAMGGGAACSTTTPNQMAGAGAYDEGDAAAYQASLDRWSDEARTYDVYETLLIVKGTLLTPSFQEAYGHEQARRKLLPPQERDAEIDSALRMVFDTVQIVFGASSPRHPNMALTKQSSPWKVRLYDDAGHWAPPLEIKAYPELSRLQPSVLFPYLTRWDNAYVAQFPLSPEGSDRTYLGSSNGKVILQIAGEPGAAQLSWAVDASAVETERPIPTPFPEPTEAPTTAPAPSP